MRRRNLDALIAWLDAARRADAPALSAMLTPDATWQGIRPEWVCHSPDEVVEMFLERSADLEDAESLELTADETRAALLLRAPSLAAVDERLRGGVHITFTFDAEGRVARIEDTPRRQVFPRAEAPAPVPEAPVESGVAKGPGWFVVNAADTPWVDGYFGAYTRLEGDARFEHIGVNIGVMQPGQPACWYHREDEQEDFLVLKGEALLLVEGQERHLKAWDFVHCPPWTDHVFLGAGAGPCTVLAIGGRTHGATVYPVSELALRHGAGVTEEVRAPANAYEGIAPDEPTEFDPAWLPR
jgi:uncharacterized cupin superfamily protein